MKKSLFHQTQRKGKRGVALVYFAMVFGVMLATVMMLLNTSVLIYQKIRLQTAVDLASYAGASVQASYLGNDASGEESIRALNQKILSRYGNLLNEMQFGSVVPWPVMFPDTVSCVAACQAANVANGQMAVSLYQDAVADIEGYRNQIRLILEKLPEASRAAAEATLRANIPELSLEGSAFGGGNVTRDAEEVVRAQKTNLGGAGTTQASKNAVLSFSSKRGLYLTNVIGNVPHSFAYFGPACWPLQNKVKPWTNWYCTVNGAGVPGGPEGYFAAALAMARVFIPVASGNVGNLARISGENAKAIRLHYVQDPYKPDPFFLASAEWYPENGSFMNMENSLGAKGSLFPTRTRLVAMSAAEPFGANLATSQGNLAFGTRLQSIRKLLLDPRMTKDVREDFGPLFKYMESLSPRDQNGQPLESAEDVIRRFLH